MAMPMYYVFSVDGGPWSIRRYPREESAAQAGVIASGGVGTVTVGRIGSATVDVRPVATYPPTGEIAYSVDGRNWETDPDIDATVGEYYTARVRPVCSTDLVPDSEQVTQLLAAQVQDPRTRQSINNISPRTRELLAREIGLTITRFFPERGIALDGLVVTDVQRHIQGTD